MHIVSYREGAQVPCRPCESVSERTPFNTGCPKLTFLSSQLTFSQFSTDISQLPWMPFKQCLFTPELQWQPRDVSFREGRMHTRIPPLQSWLFTPELQWHPGVNDESHRGAPRVGGKLISKMKTKRTASMDMEPVFHAHD
jgi:hypothetical protein